MVVDDIVGNGFVSKGLRIRIKSNRSARTSQEMPFRGVRPTPQDVLQVCRSLGAEKASDEKVLFALFETRFVEAMKNAAKSYDFKDLVDAQEAFCNQIVRLIGEELNGFTLDSAVVEHVEQTPLEFLDPRNILDAEGIRRITGERMERESRENRIRRKKKLEDAREELRRRI